MRMAQAAPAGGLCRRHVPTLAPPPCLLFLPLPRPVLEPSWDLLAFFEFMDTSTAGHLGLRMHMSAAGPRIFT